ncbi:MAG: TetM/TetW/TetO/TetS family tetracycline resistance ribosomal protection protein [Clostridiales bacterium]|jgi:ribosomal protection tetracycline resistance protein|nr:TetM/TetW/TetO/TetS family tetracycline resistance ribosomal protection protein [Clostridiales bacterium]
MMNKKAYGKYIVNLGLLAHVDAGKTTAAEHMLYLCGEISKPGSVDKGSAQTDWLPIERSRGISVQSASANMRWKNCEIHMIDTPGHTDFIGEVERALSAIDSAVLIISALEGIQPQTEIFWAALRNSGIPTILFINKTDRAGCDLEALKKSIENLLSPNLLALNRVEGAGTRDCEVFDEPLSEEAAFVISQFYPDIAERFLADEQIGQDELALKASELAGKGLAFPLVYGAASMGKGIPRLLDAISEYLPKTALSPDGEPSGIIYKITHDKGVGKIAHVRMFQGELKNRNQITLRRGDLDPFPQKITQIKRASGRKLEELGVVRGGEAAAICGLFDSKAGDRIGDAPERDFSLASALFSAKVSLVNPGGSQDAELRRAIEELTDEDPLLDSFWNNEEKELIIKIMGPVQLEILTFLLKDRYNLDVSFSQPTVIYKETPIKSGRGFEAYTMPKPCWAVVDLEISPLPLGGGLIVESTVNDNQMLPRYQRHVLSSIPQALKQGLYGWEVADLRVRLVGGHHHLMHTHPMDFFLATPMAVMNGLLDCGTRLLEPVNLVKISASEEHLSKVIGDVTSFGGSFDSPAIKSGKFHMEALLPAAATVNYPIALASLTGGHGSMSAKFHGYKDCPPDFRVQTKRRGVNPLDRAKWILTMRNALG